MRQQSDHLDGGRKPLEEENMFSPLLSGVCRGLWDLISWEAGTGITDQPWRVDGREGGGRGTGSRPWPSNRWFPKRHIQGRTQVWCLRTSWRTALPRQACSSLTWNMTGLFFRRMVWADAGSWWNVLARLLVAERWKAMWTTRFPRISVVPDDP